MVDRLFESRGMRLPECLWHHGRPMVLAVLLVAWLLGVRVYVVQSGSMLPSLAPGSLVVVLPIDFDKVQVGTVVCFSRGGQLVAHRVKAIEGTGLITQGDNNTSLDPGTVGRDDLKGQVGVSIPGMGWPVLLMRASPLLVAGLGALGCAGYLARHSKRRHRTIG